MTISVYILSHNVSLGVSDPPEIEVEKSWVHSGEGYRAELVCLVHGEPDPTVSLIRKTSNSPMDHPKPNY